MKRLQSLFGIAIASTLLLQSTAVGAATYSFETLIKTRDAPSELGGLTFGGTVAGPVINNSLEALGNSSLDPRAPSGVGFRILRYDGSSFDTLVESGAQVPGFADATIDLLPTIPTINNDGDILFSSALSGQDAGFPADDGLFRLKDGKLELLARGGDVIDGAELGPFTIDFQTGAINNNGRVAFQATFDDETSTSNTGIFLETPSGFSLVVRQGDEIDGRNGARVGSIGRADIADDGAVYFSSTYTDENGSNQGPAVFKYHNGTLSVALEPNTVVADSQLTSFQAELTDVNASGDFVVGGRPGRGDLIKSVDGIVEEVLANGGLVPGFDNPLLYFSNAVINGGGDVAFYGSENSTSFCGGSSFCGLFAEVNGELGTVVQRGDIIEVAPGDFRVLSSVSVNPRGDFMNDLGQIGFLAAFNGFDNPGLGDTQAWIVATPNIAPVPLPASGMMALIAFAFLGLVKARRVRRIVA